MNDVFKKKIITLAGEKGKLWLNALPTIIQKYEEEWEIKVLPPFNLSYNYVCPAETKTGQQVVLKISFPGNKEFSTEIAALKLFAKESSIQILKENLTEGVVLLERAVPGVPLSAVKPDKEQIHYAAEVIKNLHLPIKDNNNIFPSLSDWAKGFERYKANFTIDSGPIPKSLFKKAEGLCKDFLQDKKEQVLLHGDLHNDNILSSQRGWLVIDPKGIIGEREFELGAYLRNPFYDLPKNSDYKKLQTARILQFAEELSFDKERIQGWSFICAVLSLIWFLEDEGAFSDLYVQNAELLNSLKL